MKRCILIILSIILLSVQIQAATPEPPNIETIRVQEADQLCAQQVKETQEAFNDLAEETDKRFVYHVNHVTQDIDNKLRLFKFTNGITTFLVIFMALGAHELMKRRRERKIAKLDASLAQKAKKDARDQ